MLLAVLFTVSGVVHLVRPEVFAPIVPDALPAHRLLVYLSGAGELLCAAGLAWRRTRRLAGWSSVALLVAVFPANVTMALNAWHSWDRGGAGASSGWYLTGTILRLPMQLPLVWWAWVAARSPGRARRPRSRTSLRTGRSGLGHRSR